MSTRQTVSGTDLRQTGIRQRSLRNHCRFGHATELALVLATGALLVLGGGAQAQELRWDTITGSGVNGGTGTWDADTANWTEDFGVTNRTWVQGSIARFEASPGTVTVVGTQEVGGIDVISGGYLIDGAGQLQLVGSPSVVDVFNGTTLNIGAQVSGAAALEKVGMGTLTLSGANSYTGTTTVRAGTLVAGSNSALGGTAGGTVVEDGATLELSGGSPGSYVRFIGEALTLNGAGVGGTRGALSSTSGAYQWTGPITLGSDSLVRSDSFPLLISGAIINNNGHELATAGTGYVYLYGDITGSGALTTNARLTLMIGDNTYTGTTTVESGTLAISGGNAIADTSDVFVASGGIFEVGGNETVGNIEGSGNIELRSILTVGAANEDSIFSGDIYEFVTSGGLQKTGTGTLTLSGASTYTGSTTISGGTLYVTGSIAGDVTVEGGTLQIGNSNAIGGTITTTGSVIAYDNGVTEASEIILDSNTTQLSVAGTDAAVQAGVISELNGPRPLEKIGTGTLTLSAANTYTGATTITEGTLVTGGADALGSGAVIVKASATLETTGGEQIQQPSALTLDGTLVLGGDEILVGLNGAGTGAVSLGANTLSLGTTGGIFRGAINGTGGIRVFGGNQVLQGNNTFTGTAEISAGQLTLNGGGTLDTTDIRINGAGAELETDGSALAAGAIIQNAGTLQIFNGTESIASISGAGAISLEGGALVLNSGASSVSGVISGSGSLEVAGGVTTLSGMNTFTGGIEVSEGALVLSGGGALSDTSAVAVELGAMLQVLDSERTGRLINRGTVNLSGTSGTAGTILTVAGNYSAASDLVLDVVLEGDASVSDRLVVEGDTSGTTDVYVINQGGTGAATATGILVVDVGGTSAGSFVLANGDTALPGGQTGISAGSYVYALRDMGGDWYLQSQLQPTTVVYEALPAALMGQMQAQGLMQRLAGRQMLGRDTDGTGGGTPGITASSRGMAQGSRLDGAWLSVSGAEFDVTPDGSSTGLSYEQSTWRMQGGLDMVLHEGSGGVWIGGASLFAGGSDLDATSALGGGSVASDARGVGLTATWYGDTGFYADLQLEYSRFDSDVASDSTAALADGLEGIGRFASVEMGQDFALENGLTLTPQAQLSWAEVEIDSFDTGGATVSAGDSESVQLRLGLAAEHAWSAGTATDARLYGIANVTREFRGDTDVLIDTTTIETSAPDWTAELGVGGSYDWQEGARQTSLYGEINATRAISGGDLTGLSGTVGLRVTW